MSDVFEYRPKGTCSVQIFVKINDGIVEDARFVGGCPGNQQGVVALMRGMTVSDVISRLKGIQCGNKGTSCPDQMACALQAYQKQKGL